MTKITLTTAQADLLRSMRARGSASCMDSPERRRLKRLGMIMSVKVRRTSTWVWHVAAPGLAYLDGGLGERNP